MSRMSETMLKDLKIGIIGSGLIGRSFAMIFASAGYKVYLYDIMPSQVTDALFSIKEQFKELTEKGLLRGTLSPDEQYQRISGTSSIDECVHNAYYVQECVPERLELKRSVYEKIDPLLSDSTILASSASALIPSVLSENLIHKTRFIVVHPTNPPFYAPLVELVPAPWTDADVVTETKRLCDEVGQVPVVLKKEIDGFVLNRIQYAIIGECWRLVQDDVMTAEDVDKVMSEGLGRRYAFMGPLETAFLNADGWISYADRYADMIHRVTNSFGPHPRLEGNALQHIHDSFLAKIPLDKLNERRKWRDIRLAALEKLRKEMN